MIQPAQRTAKRAATRLRQRSPFLIRSTTQLLCLLVCAVASQALADGGHIAYRGVSDSYSITLFTAPEPLVSGPVDLSLLVEDAVTGEVLSDATVTATLSRSGSDAASEPIRLSLTHAAAGNKLLLAATPTLPAPGNYVLVLHLARPGTQPASFTVQLSVAADHRRRTTLLFALVLPLAAIFLFLANQQAKIQRRPGPDGPSALH